MIYEEEHTVRLTVEQISYLNAGLWRYAAELKERGLEHTAREMDDLYESLHRITCRAYGWKENTNAKEIEVHE